VEELQEVVTSRGSPLQLNYKKWVTCSHPVVTHYNCDTGMSVDNVTAVVNIKKVKGRFIANKFSPGWVVGVVKSVEKKKSVAGQFAVKYTSERYCWTQKLNKEDYGVDKSWVVLAVVKE
jgi:hypothetical protein